MGGKPPPNRIALVVIRVDPGLNLYCLRFVLYIGFYIRLACRFVFQMFRNPVNNILQAINSNDRSELALMLIHEIARKVITVTTYFNRY